MRCIIHIGMHKTGSTSIQHSLHGFSDDRFLYAHLGDGPNHSLAMYSLFADSPERHHLHKANGRDGSAVQDYIAKVRIDLARAISIVNGRTLLISGEDICVLQPKALEELCSYFRGHFDDLMICGYVRPPAGYISSGFQERVKGGQSDRVSPEQVYRNYEKIFGKFDEVFGRENVQLWKFEPKSFPGGCAVQDFCTRLEISFPVERVIRANESLSRQAVSLLYTYRRFCQKRGFRGIKGGESQRVVAMLADVQHDKFRFSPDIVRPVLETNRADIQWMEERLGESLHEELGAYRPGDVRDEADLLQPDPEVVKKLLALLGDTAPAGIKGETPEEVAVLMHALIIVPAKTMSASGTKMPNGKVVRVEPEVVTGWAIGADPEQPIRVALLVNGVEVAQIVADKPRPELKERGLHPTGRCGFVFRFGSARRLQIGDQVMVKPVSGDWGTDFGGDMSMVCCADGKSSIERKYGQGVRSKSLNDMSLDNDGVCLLNLNLTPPSPGTYVVLGAPRGGTSMLSGALHISGVPMGETLTAGTYEDAALISAISAHNIDHVKALIKRREQLHLQWGWKQPKDFEYFFREVMPLLACPRLLVVFRDLMAVGNRNRISAGSDLFQSMRDTSGAYSAIIAGLAAVQCPIMLLSYEKALLRPAVVVEALLEFTGIAALDKSAITSFIAPSPTEYVKSSYLGIGRVEIIRQDRVVGWASWRDKRSPIVECFINGKFVSESKADRRREDVRDKGMHETGNCGFSFQLNGSPLICSGDMVSVRIKGSGKDLMGSRVYKGESDSGENPGKST